MAGLDTVPNTAAPAIRPFRVSIPESSLQTSAGAWRRRGGSSGRRSPTKPVQRAKLQPLMDYWSTDYDWRKAEAKLNPLPQFVTEIDGLDMISGPKRGSGEWTVRPILTPAWERS